MNFEHLNVMIVDDNVHMRKLVKTILGALGVRALRECVDGVAGLEELENFAADIVVVDWVMTPMDGIEFVTQARNGKDSPNPFVPIIMMTGYTSAENVKRARDSGVNGFVAKPISARLLYDRFDDVLQRPRPFVRTESYFGPDRRRRALPIKDDNRIKDALAVAV
jgi:two-component system chemotaxis response regulator CheY